MNFRAVLFLVNPQAGGGRAGRIDWRKVCASLPMPCRAVLSASPQDALRQAREFCQSGGEVVVVAGGDGSVHAVLPALLDSPTALAVVPSGTSNVLARELGYPLGRRALQGCLDALQQAEVRQIDVGMVNGRPFVLMTSAGFDAYALERVPNRLKRRLGVFAFIWTGVRALRCYQPTRYRVHTGRELHEFEAVLLVVSNASRYGWFTVIAPSARMNDGVLDVLYLPAETQWKWHLWRVAWDVFLGKVERCPYIQRFRAQSLHIEAHVPQPFQCDGELVGMTPMEVRLLPEALRVIAASPPALSRSAA